MTTTAPPIPLRPAPRPAPVRTGPAAPPTAPGAGRMLAWLRLHWLTILFCGGLLGGALASAAWTFLPSKYESYALLRVASAPFTVSNSRDPNRGRTEFATYIKTNAGLIKNEFVLNRALSLEIDGQRIGDLPTIKEQKNPFQFLEDELLVSTQDGSELIRLTLKGHNPEDVRRIVNAVQTAFMEEVIEKEIKERQAFLLVLETTLINLQRTLNDKSGKPTDPNLRLAGGDGKAPQSLPPGIVANGPPEWVKRQIAAAQVSRTLALQEQLADLPLAIATQKSRIEQLKKRLEQPKESAPAPSGLTPEMIVAAVERDPDVRALDAEEQILRREYALERSRYSNPDAPAIVAKARRADEMAVELAKLKDAKAKLFAQVRPNAPVGSAPVIDPRLAEFDAAVLRLQELEAMQAASKLKLVAAQEELVRLPHEEPFKPAEFRKIDDKKGIDPNDSLAEAEDGIFRGLAQNAAALRLDLSSPKRVSVLQTASSPMQKDTRRQILATAFAALLGFGLVGLISFGYEATAQRACGLADVAATAGIPVVGVVPWENADSLLEPVRRMEIAESVDKLRTYVTQTWLPRGATTVAVTSARSDEGKAFTAFALATSLAEAGYRTLLADFDLRAPAIHGYAKLGNAAGVCELLRGESDFARTIQIQSNGLHVLPAGNWSDDVRRVAGSGRLEQLLRCLKEPYDCVILHAHPLLTAAESLEVARRSEVILVCAKFRETALPLLKRAVDRAAAMEVPFTGTVYLGATSREALC
jgi:succinoglycan biosynthesis transport protein ExoP